MKTLLTLLLAIFIGQIVQAGTVSGNVLYQGDSTNPINNVVVTLREIGTTTTTTFVTGPDGFYEFQNVASGTYQILGIKDAPGVGVTMLDATMVLFHILGALPFNDIQTLAADVTGDKLIKMNDFTLIVKHIAFHTPFPVGDWVFLNEIITVNDFKASNPGGLTGSSSGDVGGSFVPGTRDLEAYPIANAGKVEVSSDEPVTVSIKTNEDLSLLASGLIINYPSGILQIESVEFPADGYEYVIEGNQLRVLWSNESGQPINIPAGSNLVTIHAVTTSSFTEGMSVNLSLNGSTSLVNNDLTEIKSAKLEAPTIEYSKPSLRLSNYPNPFATTTTLNYFLPESGAVTVGLYDQNGRLIKEYKLGELAEGYHTYTLEGSGLTPGNYYCKLNLSGVNTETIRLLKTN
jgi:hypothetical protein